MPTRCLHRAGLDGFDTVDAAFFFTVTDLTADLSNLLSFSSANVLLRLLTGQLNDVSPHCRIKQIITFGASLVSLWPDVAQHSTNIRAMALL